MKIVHLYHDLMNLYGEYGNVCMLKRCLEEKGQSVEIIRLSVGDEFDFTDCNLVYIGSGTERNQKVMLEDIKQQYDKLKSAEENGAVILATGNSYEIFGAAVVDADGTIYKGLGRFNYVTEESRERTVDDVTCTCDFADGKIIGFINKCSSTKGVNSPMFTVVGGNGNSKGDSSEGVREGNFYGTHIIGPLLVRNPAVCEYFAGLLIDRASKKAE